MLITKVKVDKITNLSEARYCAGMGVDYLSFTSSVIDPKTYQEITGWVAGPKFGIEVSRENFDTIQNYETDFVLINHDCLDLLPPNVTAVFQIDLSEWKKIKAELIKLKEKILFLEFTILQLDNPTENLIEEISKDFDLFIKLSNVEFLNRVLKLPVAGISLEGANEQRPGLKEYPLSDILEKLDAD